MKILTIPLFVLILLISPCGATLTMPQSGNTLVLKKSLKATDVLEEVWSEPPNQRPVCRMRVRTTGHCGELIVTDTLDPFGHPDPDKRLMVSAERLIVSTKRLKDAAAAVKICREYGMKVRWENKKTPLFEIQVPERSLANFDALLGKTKELLKSLPVHVEPDYLITDAFCGTPNDPLLSEQWSLNKIEAGKAWDIGTGSEDVLVCVIDSGIDLDHPDLVSNLWVNSSEIPGNIIDDDANGYIDDVNGYNFADNYQDDNNPTNSYIVPPNDDLYHGSFCAGIIGAVGNNSLGIAGICHRVKLVSLKASSYDDVYAADIARSMHYARMLHDKGLCVVAVSISMSIFQYNQAIQDGMDVLEEVGILACCSAGNSSSDHIGSPANLTNSNVIAVGASAPDDSLWYVRSGSGSNWHSTQVHIAAPGQDIKSTVPSFFYGTQNPAGYASSSGTSFSTPIIAGACALLKSINPSLTGSEMRQIIFDTADPIPAWQGKCLTGARLNLFKAAREAAGRLPVTVNIESQPNQLHFSWNSVAGFVYDLEYAQNMTSGIWTPITNGMPGGVFIDTIPERISKPAGFYRLKRRYE